jgi:hypothetical protein
MTDDFRSFHNQSGVALKDTQPQWICPEHLYGSTQPSKEILKQFFRHRIFSTQQLKDTVSFGMQQTLTTEKPFMWLTCSVNRTFGMQQTLVTDKPFMWLPWTNVNRADHAYERVINLIMSQEKIPIADDAYTVPLVDVTVCKYSCAPQRSKL